jgi:4-methyl-5(b-hydroxyethyl)-thiazole monophosphate biosynthesis
MEAEMKRSFYSFLTFIFLFLLIASPTVSCAEKVLMILRHGSFDFKTMLEKEVLVMIKLIKEAGYTIVTASETGETLGYGGSSITPDAKLIDINLKDFAGVIIPCMSSGTAVSIAPAIVVSTVQKAFDMSLPIAAGITGVVVLEKAGLLKGKKFAIEQSMQNQIPDGIYMGSGVVQDGNIITSGSSPIMPGAFGDDGVEALTKAFLKLLKSKT